ncbi:MAG: hypothetical protein ACYCQJ_01690 [Nitrososphaerales archaeon]
MGRTIPSFEMIIGQEINRVNRTFGKKLTSKQEREILNQTLNLCEHYSYACSKALKLVPMRSILMAITLDHEKKIQLLMQELEEMRIKS